MCRGPVCTSGGNCCPFNAAQASRLYSCGLFRETNATPPIGWYMCGASLMAKRFLGTGQLLMGCLTQKLTLPVEIDVLTGA